VRAVLREVLAAWNQCPVEAAGGGEQKRGDAWRDQRLIDCGGGSA
jgi:hypothetical protein